MFWITPKIWAKIIMESQVATAMQQSKVEVNDPILFDPADIFSPTLITPKMARGRTFAGFSEIRIKQSTIECDYIMSNGTLTSHGTFSVLYQPGDEASKLANAVTVALGDAFKKFERLKT